QGGAFGCLSPEVDEIVRMRRGQLVHGREGSGIGGACRGEPVPQFFCRPAGAWCRPAEFCVGVGCSYGLLAPHGDAVPEGSDQLDIIGRQVVDVRTVAGDLHECAECFPQLGGVVAVHQNSLMSAHGSSRSRATSSMSSSSSTWSLSTPW